MVSGNNNSSNNNNAAQSEKSYQESMHTHYHMAIKCCSLPEWSNVYCLIPVDLDGRGMKGYEMSKPGGEPTIQIQCIESEPLKTAQNDEQERKLP